MEVRLQMVQAKVVHAATDNTVTLTWARKSRLDPHNLLTAFEFLDQQVPDGEWQIRFEQLHFPDGQSFLQWIGIVSTSVITSATLSERNRTLTEQLLERRYACVIWDEVHKIRRANLSPGNVHRAPEKKSLYRFAERLAACTRTMLLATATPVQLHPMELWDLLSILSVNNPQVMGTETSLWRKADETEISTAWSTWICPGTRPCWNSARSEFNAAPWPNGFRTTICATTRGPR